MPDYIEWYVVEIERVGRSTLSIDKIAELQGEVRAHLSESSASYIADGLSEEDASREAVTGMGSVHDLVEQSPKRLWAIFWMSMTLIPLFFLALELGENGINAEYGFYPMLIVMVLMVVSSYRVRKIQTLPLLLVPVAAFLFLAFFLPAWFIDLGDLDGYGLVSRFDLYMGWYEGEALANINASNSGFTYWQQVGGFLPSALLSSAWMFGIVGFAHMLGVYLRRIVDWSASRRSRLSFR